MKIRSTEELAALLTGQKGITLDVNDNEVSLTIDVREENYFLEGNKDSLLSIGFYNPNNTADDFVIDSFENFEDFESVEKLYLTVLENHFDNSMEDMRSEAGQYYSNRDY
jgi:hypothetical protein